MSKLRVSAIMLIILLSIPAALYAQQTISFFDEEKDSPCVWSRDLLRLSAFNANHYGLPGDPLPITAAVNDPFYNSSNSWGQGYDDMWGLKRLNIEDAWKLSKGSGVTIAFIDSGLDYTHADIDDNLWINDTELNGVSGVDDDGNGYVDDYIGWDFVSGGNNPYDLNGHGTHVAGIAAAEGNNSTGIIGVAYEAKVMALRILDAAGYSADYSAVAAAIHYAVDMGARVLNCSFGTPSYVGVLVDAFQYAFDHGAIIVAAAGNYGSPISLYPALLDYVITVGSIGWGEARSSFSDYGPDLDVVVPGEDILSLYPSGQYAVGAGTSMAAPFVSGVVALMLSKDPTLTFADISRRLKFSAYDLGAAGWDQYYGWGLADAFSALSHDWYDSGVVKTWWLTEPDADNVVRFDYNESSQITRKTFNTGAFRTYDYQGATLWKEKHYSTVGSWQKTIQFWTDGTTKRYEWILNGVEGTTVYKEFNATGQIIKQKFADNSYYQYYYSSGVLYKEYHYSPTGAWQKTIYYRSDGVTKYYENILNGVEGNTVYKEYNTSGQLLKQKFADNSYYWFVYSSGVLYKEYHYSSTGAWQKTIFYRPDGVTRYYENILNGVEGTSVYKEYNSSGQIIKDKFADNSYYQYFYQSGVLFKEYHYSPAGAWQKTIQYWTDGVTEHYEWRADPNPGTPGDLVYIEFNIDGIPISGRLDDGTPTAPGGGMSASIARSSLELQLDPDAVAQKELEAALTNQNNASNGVTFTNEMAGKPVNPMNQGNK